jgi:hypothetical protein
MQVRARVAETNGGHIYRFEPRSGELLEEWRIEGVRR